MFLFFQLNWNFSVWIKSNQSNWNESQSLIIWKWLIKQNNARRIWLAKFRFFFRKISKNLHGYPSDFINFFRWLTWWWWKKINQKKTTCIWWSFFFVLFSGWLVNFFLLVFQVYSLIMIFDQVCRIYAYPNIFWMVKQNSAKLNYTVCCIQLVQIWIHFILFRFFKYIYNVYLILKKNLLLSVSWTEYILGIVSFWIFFFIITIKKSVTFLFCVFFWFLLPV